MQVEHVARIGFAARRAAQQQRHLTIGNSLLREIVINDQAVHAVVAEEFAHGGAGVRREVLQRSGLRSGGGNNDGVFHRAVFFELLHDLRNGGALLAHGDVDAVELLALVVAVVPALLVDEGIDGDGGLTGLTVTNDQLTLAAADGHERVNRLDAGLHGLVHRLTRDDAGGLLFHALASHVLERALAVDRVAERIDHAAEQTLADGNVHNGAGALDAVAFLDLGVRAEDHDADVIGFEVQGHALHTGRKGDHFARLYVVEAVDTGNAVPNGQHGADFADFGLGAEAGDLVLDDLGDFSGADFHH